MRLLTEREFAGLRVVLTGGSDGKGGGDGPLVVLLHGFGAPGRDLVPLAQVLPAPPGTRYAFPAAPLSLGGSFGADMPGFAMFDSRAWWQIDIERFERAISQAQRQAQGSDRRPGKGLNTPAIQSLLADVPAGLAAARTQLLRALDEMEQALAVPSGQIVLGGFSQGSMLALDVALRSRRPLAGLLLLSTTLICQNEWLPLLAARRGLRVLQSHGQQDPLLPFFIAEVLADHLRSAGLSVEFVPFTGGHEIPQPVLRAASAFLLSALAPRPTDTSSHG